MALAINRREIIDNIAQADQLPATGFTPQGMPGFDVINPNSPWLPENGDLEQAKELMAKVAEPEEGHQAAPQRLAGPPRDRGRGPGGWKELGHQRRRSSSRSGRSSSSSSARRRTSRSTSTGSAGSATTSTRSTSSSSGRATRGTTSTNYCDPEYDELVEKARETPDNDGAVRALRADGGDAPRRGRRTCRSSPIYWYTYIQPGAAERSRTRSTSTCSTRST